jgi:hypothetical protein
MAVTFGRDYQIMRVTLAATDVSAMASDACSQTWCVEVSWKGKGKGCLTIRHCEDGVELVTAGTKEKGLFESAWMTSTPLSFRERAAGFEASRVMPRRRYILES